MSKSWAGLILCLSSTACAQSILIPTHQCVWRAGDNPATLVNAGHLPPFLNGMELQMEGAHPLGTAPNISFPISRFNIAEGDDLVLMTDGVVEAQSSTGELFGFDRIAAISTQSAEAIARAAQQFGQEDDITVLTLTFAPAEVLHA
ncbi:MAG: PP2C family protein-serine/threonine phosphatase [Acidobacteriota bacterium]